MVIELIMLERDIAKEVNKVLAWAIEKQEHNGEQLAADKIRALRSLINTRLDGPSGSAIMSALGRAGGQIRSEKKAEASKKNGAFGGFPGRYYAKSSDGPDKSAKYLYFRSKENRDLWCSCYPGTSILATDTGLRAVKRNQEDALIDGDKIVCSLEQRVEYEEQFECQHDLRSDV
jgi:hypothetical protein